MREYVLLLLSTVLVNNVVLVKFLGLCPFMGISKKTDTAISMGLATTFVMTMASAACWMLEHWLLVPLGMTYLRILVYILVIAVVVQVTEMVVRKTNPALYQVLGIYLPHHHQLRGAGHSIANHAGEAAFREQPDVRLRLGCRLHPGVVAIRRAARTAGPGASAACVRRRTHWAITASLLALAFMGFLPVG
jgi:electron transport complex protein RnfA